MHTLLDSVHNWLLFRNMLMTKRWSPVASAHLLTMLPITWLCLWQVAAAYDRQAVHKLYNALALPGELYSVAVALVVWVFYNT